MKDVLAFLFCAIVLVSCSKTIQTQFSEAVLTEEHVDLNGDKIKFGDILSKYKGRQIVIDVWASWCRDCIVGLPELKALQKDKPDAVFLFLSADRNLETWKRAIKKYEIKGEHYFLTEGTKGVLGKFVDIDWIPRYMIVDSKGQIELFEAIEADDPLIKEILK